MRPLPPSSRAGIRPGKKRRVFSPRPRSYSPRSKTRGLLSGVIYLYANKMSIPRGRLKKNPAVFSSPRGQGLGPMFTGSLHCTVGLANISGLPVGMSLSGGQGRVFYFLFHGGSLGFTGEQARKRQESVNYPVLTVPNPHSIQRRVSMAILLMRKPRPQE